MSVIAALAPDLTKGVSTHFLQNMADIRISTFFLLGVCRCHTPHQVPASSISGVNAFENTAESGARCCYDDTAIRRRYTQRAPAAAH